MITNEEYLTAVSKAAPEFGKILSRGSRNIFNENGYEALQNLPGTEDNVTKFYQIALLVGQQFVEHAKYRDPLEDMGILTTHYMNMGKYLQKNRVKRIKNVNPAWLGADGKGLKNGDSVDQWIVRKPEIIQEYYSCASAYQNFITLQDFDLKGGWITEGGIDDIVSAVYQMIDLDRIDYRFSLFYKVLNGAINSTNTPLLDTQKLSTPWTTGTDAEVRGLIELLKNIEESITTVPSVDNLNAAGVPNSAGFEDMVLLVRPGIKSKIESALAYAYNAEKLQFNVKVKVAPNFGGLEYYAASDTNFTTPLKPVDDAAGVYTGFYSVDGTTSGQIAEADLVTKDPNENIFAILAEKGVIFNLARENSLKVRNGYNIRGEYQQTYFNEIDGNSFNYAHDKNLITISKA